MNNYDFNYNGNMINGQEESNKFITDLVLVKWINYLSLGFIIFQFFFFIGFSIFSVLISLFIIYICYSLIIISRKDTACIENETQEIIKKITSLYIMLNIAILLHLLDIIYCSTTMKSYIQEIFYSDDYFQRKFGFFICYSYLMKFILLVIIRYILSKMTD